jgi:hypothetical protein
MEIGNLIRLKAALKHMLTTLERLDETNEKDLQ